MPSTYIKKERLWVTLFLICICLVMAQNVHRGWYVSETALAAHPPPPDSPHYHIFGEPPTHVPEAYRVAVPFLGHLVVKSFHVADPSRVAAAFDFISGLLACYLFYRVALDHLPEDASVTSARLGVIALFLAFLQFPMAWIVPSQRPETLPTALYLAASLFSLTRLTRSNLWIAILLVITVAQAFTRTDAPLVFGAALVLLSLFPRAIDGLGSRRLIFTLGTLIVLLDTCIQAYLQLVRFPNLHAWPNTPVSHLSDNLHSLNAVADVTLALLPFLIVAASLIIRRPRLDAIDQVILLTSAMYLLFYFVFGILSEVRLYVPFMLALSVVSAKHVAAAWHEKRLASQSNSF